MLEYLILLIKILGGVLLFFLILFFFGKVFWQWKEVKKKIICLKIKPNRLSERNPNVAEQIFSALHSIYKPRNIWEKLTGKNQSKISFEIANCGGKVSFFIRLEEKFKKLAEGQFYAHYPHSEIEEVADYTNQLKVEGKKSALSVEMKLTDADIWPIKRFSQFEDKIARTVNDPISGLLLPVSKLNSLNEQAWVQVVLTPMSSNNFRRRGIKCLQILEKHYKKFFWLKDLFEKKFISMGFWRRFKNLPYLIIFWIMRGGSSGKKVITSNGAQQQEDDLDMEMSRSHERENETSASSDKLSRLVFNTTIRIVHFPEKGLETISKNKLHEIAAAFKQFNLPQLNGFKISKIEKGSKKVKQFQSLENNDQMILSTEEIATVFHLPNNTVQIPNIDWVFSKKLEPPQNLPSIEKTSESLTLLGKTNFRGFAEEFGIKQDDRRRHIYIVGKTGMGKSTLLENMIFSDIISKKGVAVIDPHGDLADAVLNFVPVSRTNDVILFDPSDREFPVSFNMLECKDPDHRHLVASGVLGVFKKIFADSWGPRLEHILRNTLLSLIEAKNTTMLGIMKILTDEHYRKKVLDQCTDPMVISFWENEFGRWRPQQVTEAISPIQNKVGQFLSSSLTRNILGQPKSSIDLRFAMDKGKIIIINLSKGKIGEDNSSLLGSMLVTKFQLDIMSRADIPESKRKDFYLYVDEFQNFATDAFATILSEARKYRLNLTVANQYLAQMPDEVRDAIFGNVGTMITFQVGFDDAEVLANQFGGEESGISSIDIGGLPKYQTYLRLMIDGMPSNVFSAATLPPPEFEIEANRIETLLKVSRERYAKKRSLVEERIKKWSL